MKLYKRPSKLALAEDLYPHGDITSNLLKKNKIITAKLIVIKKRCCRSIICQNTFYLIDKKIKFIIKKDGSSVKKNSLIAIIKGKAILY